MAYTKWQDEVAPSTGRVYNIDTSAGTITDITAYEQQGTQFGAAAVQDIGILEANYTKSGTVHQLTTENTDSIQMRFTATAAFNAGDSFTVNGTAFSVRTTNGVVTLPSNWFVANSIVMFFVDWTNHILYLQYSVYGALAEKAIALNQSRGIRTNLASTSTVQFDGTADVAPGVTGTLPVGNGGTGVTSNPSMLTNLGSTTADTVFKASPRPGVTGTLGVAHGGTGQTSVANIQAGKDGSGNTITSYYVPKGGTTMTGTLYAKSANVSGACVRNETIQNSSGTNQSSNYLIFRRK